MLRPARCRGDHQSSDHRKVAATARVVAATEPAVVATAPSRDDAIVRHATTRRRDPCLVDTTRAARDDSRSVVTTSASLGPTRSRRDIAASRRRGTSRRDTTSVAATCRASPDPPPSPRPAPGRRDPRGSWRPGQVVATPASPRLKGSRDGDARVATTGLGSLRPASVAATRTMGRHDGAVGTTCDRSRRPTPVGATQAWSRRRGGRHDLAGVAATRVGHGDRPNCRRDVGVAVTWRDSEVVTRMSRRSSRLTGHYDSPNASCDRRGGLRWTSRQR